MTEICVFLNFAGWAVKKILPPVYHPTFYLGDFLCHDLLMNYSPNWDSRNPIQNTKLLKAYRLGYVVGLRKAFLADNLPRQFRNWLDRHFTRSENWMRYEPLEDDPPEIEPYRERISMHTPLLSLDDLENLPCYGCRNCGQIEKAISDRIIKDAILEIIRENGGSISKGDLYRKLGVETEEE